MKKLDLSQIFNNDMDIDDAVFVGKELPLIPAGEYKAIFVSRNKGAVMKFDGIQKFKFSLTFKILDAIAQPELKRYYNRPKNGKYGKHHDYLKDWRIANNGNWPKNRSKMHASIFENKIFIISVRNTQDRKQSYTYSVIDKIISVVNSTTEIPEKSIIPHHLLPSTQQTIAKPKK